MTEQDELKQLAKCMYREASCLDGGRRLKITPLFGPLRVRPDVFLVSFQGAGEAPRRSLEEPKCLLYLDDGYSFGSRLCNEFRHADLFETLEERTVAMAAYFLEKGASKADQAEWQALSRKWVRRMLRATRPRVVLVIGLDASKALELEGKWCAVKTAGRKGRVYGRAKIGCSHAVYCRGFRGTSTPDVQKCLNKVKQLIASTSGG